MLVVGDLFTDLVLAPIIGPFLPETTGDDVIYTIAIIFIGSMSHTGNSNDKSMAIIACIRLSRHTLLLKVTKQTADKEAALAFFKGGSRRVI